MILDESLKPTAYNTGQHRGLYLENMAGSGFGLFNSCRARRSLVVVVVVVVVVEDFGSWVVRIFGEFSEFSTKKDKKITGFENIKILDMGGLMRYTL